MSTIRKRAQELHKPLAKVAAARFVGLGEQPTLGAKIRIACDRLVAALSTAPDALVDWRLALEHWEELDGGSRAAHVARGLRILRAEFGALSPPAKKAKAKASENVSPLAATTDSLPGIGPALAGRLSDHGFDTVEDLLWLVPRRYDDVRTTRGLADLGPEPPLGERVTVSGEVSSANFFRRGRRRWVDVRLADGAITLAVRWFGAHQSMVARFPLGACAVLSGKLTARNAQLEMANPDTLEVVSVDGGRRATDERIIPRYRDLQGVPAATLRKAIRAAMERGAQDVTASVPQEVADRLALPPLDQSLLSLHVPPSDISVEGVALLNEQDSPWHRRMAFEELFLLAVIVALRRQANRLDEAPACVAGQGLLERVAKALPFPMTGAQERVFAEVGANLAEEIPMNRLLQGDVGAGKTAVAFAAVAQVASAARQSAIMAPTELLAQQHLHSLKPWCERAGLKLALLTASTNRAVRASTLALLAAGEIDLLIGTHALLSEHVAFSDLALVIVDEQHRFGVAQRAQLRAKGRVGSPHLLVMTATPIPRTLALTAYGDLDVSVIDELPPGRIPVRTEVLSGKKGRARAYKELRDRLKTGARAFLVCPMVEPGEEVAADWADTETAARGIAETWPDIRASVVHGRMTTDERVSAMDAFRTGDSQLLIATTVVEVGVDVPEANVMLIENADRFGLSQLHQLRGRIGRGGGEALCLLVARGGPTADGLKRLEVMGETCDGFVIAEADLRIRGPGELLGTQQAGLPKLRFGDLRRHAELLACAREEAERLLAGDPSLERQEHATLRQRLQDREDEPVYGAESG